MSQDSPKIKVLLDRMQQEQDFPAISQYINELNAKAAPTSDSSANELAALILHDYSLTSRLLKVSNSAMYGQFSGTISTVSRAVVVLGFKQVQLTTAGLVFFEHLQDKARSARVKEGVLAAFLGGILARDLAQNLRLDGWENYYIGAMFHQFGRLLAMNFFPHEFDLSRELVEKGETEEEAERKALGVPFSELGIAVAKTWSLPEQIIVSMRMPGEGELKKKPEKIVHQQLLPRLANDLCDIVMNAQEQKRQEQIKQLLDSYSKIYPLRMNEVATLVDGAIKEMQSFSDVLRLDREALKRLDQRRFNGGGKATPAAAEGAAPRLQRFEVGTPEQLPSQLNTVEERKLQLQGGIQEITNAMLEDFTLDEILGMILETIYRGIGFDRVVIFFKAPRAEKMQARYGLGPQTATMVRQAQFTIDETATDLFNLALAENKDLYIGDLEDPEVCDCRPDWFRGAVYSPSLAIYPIVINQKRIGLIYGGHNARGEHLDREQLGAIKTLRNQACLAIKQCAGG